MTPLAWAWVLSFVVAGAFFLAGWLVGRAPQQEEPARSTPVEVAVRPIQTPVVVRAPVEAPAPVVVKAPVEAPAPVLPPWRDGVSFEEGLAGLLTVLGGRLVVLADNSGLPVAAAGVGGGEELVAALSAKAHARMHRAGTLLGARARCVVLRVGEEYFVVRVLHAGDTRYTVAYLGVEEPSDTYFELLLPALAQALDTDRFERSVA